MNPNELPQTLEEIKRTHPFPWVRMPVGHPGRFTMIDGERKEIHMFTMFRFIELQTSLTTEKQAA